MGHMLIKLGKLDLEYVCFHCHTIGFGGVLTITISGSKKPTNDDLYIHIDRDMDVDIDIDI